MPVQQQHSSLAQQLGRQLAEANEAHKDQPVDTGNRRLPAGIKEGAGIARLSTLYWKNYEDDKSFPGAKGKLFFRGSAIVVQPVEHDGVKTAGMVTSQVIPLCATPEKGKRKATTFKDNWGEYQNIIRLLGVAACPETPATDPTGQKTEQYFIAAMRTLTDLVRMKTNPIYISFSTRGWTPPATQDQPKPEEMVFETWHGLATFDGKVDPAAGVSESPAAVQPGPMSAPPSPNGVPPQQPTERATAAPDPAADYADMISSLVAAAMDDPEGATEEGADASAQLEKLAWGLGWTEEQTRNATDWAQVGDMALNAPTAQPATPSGPTPSPAPAGGPAVGTVWMFAKRDKDGAKLKNTKTKADFPPVQVEVVTVDAAAQTCTVKTVKDGKDVVDIRTKQPVAVRFEWLEGPPY